ncbi:hypothetical protein [Xenorhabdus sp. BG5]|uniref:hypothetical protein n=1 Tax=Xenorhabdus sp. BG5 TaxID=2782014 RepID=UPI001D155658|nr:hypothetical protein [Xenorhabdus sp. BG5]
MSLSMRFWSAILAWVWRIRTWLNPEDIPRNSPYLGIHDELTVIFDSGLAPLLFGQDKQ